MADTHPTLGFPLISRQVGVAMLGYGKAGQQFHGGLLRTLPELRLHAAVTGNAERQAKALADGFTTVYAEPDQAFADPAVDLVVVATPHETHADLAIRALAAGKHVVVDKPFAMDVASCRRMEAAAQQHHRLLTCYHNRRWDGDWMTLRSVAASGALGEARWLEMAWQGWGAQAGWRGADRDGGGRFLDLAPHLVDQACQLFGLAVTQVWSRTDHALPGSPVDSEAHAVLGFADGRTVTIDCSSLTTVKKPRYLLRGTAGSFIKYGFDPQEAALFAGAIAGAVEAPELRGEIHLPEGVRRQVPTIPGRWGAFYQNVAAVLQRGDAPAVLPHEIRTVVAVVAAARQSARSGDMVRLDPDQLAV
jgi:scyllo-inositol 2-dehydrogenase (NADP+)